MSPMDVQRRVSRRAAMPVLLAALLGWSLGLGGVAAASSDSPEAAVRRFAADSEAPPRGSADGPLAAPADAHIKLTLRASGLSRPVFITSAHDHTGRQFIVEQTGKIRIYNNGH